MTSPTSRRAFGFLGTGRLYNLDEEGVWQNPELNISVRNAAELHQKLWGAARSAVLGVAWLKKWWRRPGKENAVQDC